jgi:hypothetical protein
LYLTRNLVSHCTGGERGELLPPKKDTQGRKSLPESITLRGRGVVPNQITPQSRGFVVQLFSMVPRRNFLHAQLFSISFGRWRLAAVTSVVGSNPARSASSGSSVGRAKSNIPSPLIPRLRFSTDETLVHNQKESRWRRRRLLRLLSRRRGFDSRPESNPRWSSGRTPKKSATVCSPAFLDLQWDGPKPEIEPVVVVTDTSTLP